MSTPELKWFKSSYSGTQGDSCVEVADAAGAVHVRDSKVAGGPELGVAPSAWASFVAFATSGAQPGT